MPKPYCIGCPHLKRKIISKTKPLRLADTESACGHSLLVDLKIIPYRHIEKRNAPAWCPDVKQLKMDLK